MKARLRPHQSGLHRAEMIRELAVPALSELREFRACLERLTGRVAELVPVVMEPGAPSGTWLRTGVADYLFYEEQTSRFHQAHIVLSVAAQLLLGDTAEPSVDPRLVPDVSPQLIRLMLGGAVCSPVTQREAEELAFLAVEHARPVSYPQPLARRALRQLRPLHAALRAAVPQIAATAAPRIWTSPSLRLHRQVIQIRDAALALRPYRDPEAASAATSTACAAGLTGEELAAAGEAAVLAAAVSTRRSGQPVPRTPARTGGLPMPGPDLRSETAWLVKVSRAFAQLQRAAEPALEAIESRPDERASWMQTARERSR